MDTVWIAIGVAILLITFLDTFLAVLNYDEPGIVVNRLVRLQWIVLRALTRRVSRRWRPLLLRQVTGVLLLTTILSWIGGIVLGFTFIYLGLIGLGAFQISEGVVPDFVGALYLSFGQFATVGADNISPAGGWVNLLPVLEALVSVVLLSFIITFLSNVYGVIQFLRSLCADFFQAGPGVGNPVDALRPYLPGGQPRDLDRHLNELVDDFNLYCDSLRQDHAAYHFQSGEEQFALPFALYMTSGVTAALRWGLPTGHDASISPSLVRLTEVFDDFRERRYRLMRWRIPQLPDVVSSAEFERDFAAFDAHSSRTAIDPWVLQFLTLDRDMAEIAGTPDSRDAADAYARYAGWLRFAAPAQQFVSRVARDLDYQPIYRGPAPEEDDTPSAPAPTPSRRRRSGILAWVRRRHLFLDPGSVRLSSALRTVGAVAIAVTGAVFVGLPLGVDPAAVGAFAALIAVFSVPMTSGWGAGLMRSTGLLALIPVGLGVGAATFIPRTPVSTVLVLAVVAGLAVWVGRVGPRWATYGQVAFIAYYFSLLLAVSPTELVAALLAAGIGVVSSWASNLLPLPRRSRQINAGVDAVAERVVVLIDSAVDVLGAGGDRQLVRAVRAENVALRNSVTSLAGALGTDTPDTVSNEQERTLQLAAFDVQLAAANLLRALPDDADPAINVDERARLAGELLGAQQRIREFRRLESAESFPGEVRDTAPDTSWAGQGSVRRVLAATDELSTAVVTLLAHPPISDTVVTTSMRARDRMRTGRSDRRTIDRRAVQVGVATGVALFLAGFVSSIQQYWAAMPAFQGLTGSDGARASTTLQRVFGAVIGAAAGFGLALWTGHDLVIAFAVLGVSVFFMSFTRSIASSWSAFWQTVLLATMYDLLARLDAEAIHIRILETLIGAVVAVIVAAVVLPTRTRARVLAGMSALVSTVAGITHAALQRLADPMLATDASYREHLGAEQSAMQRQLEDFLQQTAPLRRDPGALQRAGIEAQLTAVAALAHSARRLVADAEHGSSRMTPAEWQRLDALTSDNFQSTLAVLGGRLPARVLDPADVPEPAARDEDDGALLDVARINQALLTTMSAVRPGSTDPDRP